MPSSLTVARWYIRTKNPQLYNSFSQKTSLTKTEQPYRGNGKDLIERKYCFELLF
jgi:hypothetical protein